MSKEPRLGSGKRFQNLANKLARKGAENPKALSAWIGRRKFGSKKFDKLSEEGKHRHEE